MNQKYLTEKIRFNTEMLKIFWALLVVIISGIIGLLLMHGNNSIKVPLIILGAFFSYIAIMLIKDFNREILDCLSKLEKQ